MRRRWPEGDRPALTFKLGRETFEMLQLVGFYDENGNEKSENLEYALEQGWIKEGEIKKAKVPLSVYAIQKMERDRQSLTKP